MDLWSDELVLEQILGVTPIAKAILDAVLDSIGGYISQRHISASKYISTKPLFDLSVAEERREISLETII